VFGGTGLVLAALVLAACGGSSSAPSSTTAADSASAHPAFSQHDLTYCENGGVPEKLDVYEPAAAHGAVPAVLFIHGGGWVSGDKTLQSGSVDDGVRAALLRQGWVFVSINYRLAPAHRWPAQLQDSLCALRYLRAHAAALHIAPARMAVMGAPVPGWMA